jgi:uncharacterized protein involved in outer membrane biogenesis
VILYAAGALAFLYLVAWLAIPRILRSQLETRLTEALGRATTVESVVLDPLSLTLTVRNVAIADRTAGTPLLTLDELAADIATASIWHRAPVLDGVRLKGPKIALSRDRSDRLNIQDLVDKALAGPPGPTPRFSLNNIEVDGGSVTFDDALADRRHSLSDLAIAIPFVSSLPYETQIRVTPRVAGAFNGSRFALEGSSTPFAERREATLSVDLDALPLPAYVTYLPMKPRYDLAGGALTTRLQVAFVEATPAERRLELRGDARIDGLALKRRDGSALVGADRIAVVLDTIDVLGRSAKIASVTIDAPSVDVRRLTDGTIELAQPPFDAPPPPAPAREASAASAAPPWSASIAKLVVARGQVSLADLTSTFRSSLADVTLEATNLTTRKGDKAQVKVAFVSADRIASFAGDAEIEPLVPAASGRFELARFSLGLLFPYYKDALAVDVQKGSLDFASRFALDANGNLALGGGVATISDLVLALPGNRNPLWRVPSLAASGVDVDVAARRIAIASLASRAPQLRVVRERDGTLEMARIVRQTTGKDAGAGPDWTVVAKKTHFERVGIDFEDRVPSPAVRLAVRELDFVATDFSSARGSKAQLRVRARVGERGRLAFAGPVAMQPVSLSGMLETSGLALVALKPYVEPHVNVVLTDGALGVKGRIAVDVPEAAPARATWKGDVSVENFAALDKPTSSDLARWKVLRIDGLDVTSEPFRAAAARIALEDFYARVIIYPDASVNLARLLTPGETPEPAPDAKPAPSDASAERRALPVSIGRVDVARGNVNFSDLFVRPNYSANLTDVSGGISALSAEQAGDVAITARVDGTAPVEVQGRIQPFARELSLDVAGKARDIDLPPLTPYSVKYAGYGIEKGKLTFDVHYKVENRKLAAENRLVLDQLTFGQRIESPTATKLPVLLAVSLLKDAKGVIDIRLPISGSLDDPQFSVGGLIIQVIVNLITKAVTAPFALLSAVFGSGEELSTLDFAPGSATVAGDAQKRVDTLGKALADRPALKLDIGGRADPAADRDALQHAALETALRREKMKSLAGSGGAPASLDQVTIAPEERERWLTAAYRAAPLPDRPRNAVGMLKEVPTKDMEAMLIANAVVDDDALRQLANRRAQAVKDAIAAKGVAGERLFLVAPRLGNEAAGTKPPADDKPRDPSRVDLALR